MQPTTLQMSCCLLSAIKKKKAGFINYPESITHAFFCSIDKQKRLGKKVPLKIILIHIQTEAPTFL